MAYPHARFGIQRQTQHALLLICHDVDLAQAFKDSIRLRNLFGGDFSAPPAACSLAHSASPGWFLRWAVLRPDSPFEQSTAFSLPLRSSVCISAGSDKSG